MAQYKYIIHTKFTRFKNDGTYNICRSLELPVKTKKDLIKELIDLDIDNDKTISSVVIYDVAQRIEYHYHICNDSKLKDIKEHFNIK